jgi:PHS family inorganic phosphate transporter-like MFS transporter
MIDATADEILPPPAATPTLRDRDRGRTYGGNKAFHNFYNDYSHISDPNLRRRLALSEIDKVPFGLYRACPGQFRIYKDAG